MRDVKWEYGDIVLDSAGRAELLSESDSEFQRALIRMSAKRGCFIYDRELGATFTPYSSKTSAATFWMMAFCCLSS